MSTNEGAATPENVITGRFRPVDQHRPSDTLSRRDLLRDATTNTAITAAKVAAITKGGAIAAASITEGGIIGKHLIEHNPGSYAENVVNAISDLFHDENNSNSISNPDLFTNNETQKHAEALGLHTRDFIYPSEPLYNKQIKPSNEETLPLFHPAVEVDEIKNIILNTLDHKYKTMNHNIPMMLASLQSGGNIDIRGGLFGINSEHIKRYGKKYTEMYPDEKDETLTSRDFLDPKINTQFAMIVFADKLQIATRQLEDEGVITNSDDYNAEAIVRAVKMYVHVDDEAGTRPVEEQSESEKILTYTVRSFINTMRLAENMRAGGNGIEPMSNFEIIGNIQSLEVNAIMWAIISSKGLNLTIEDLLQYFSEDPVPNPADYATKETYDEDVEIDMLKERQGVYDLYLRFKESIKESQKDESHVKGKFGKPLNPWLRFHHALTDTAYSHIDSNEINSVESKWSSDE